MRGWRVVLARFANVGLIVFGLALLVVLGTGGTRIVVGELSIGLHRVWPPLHFFALFAALRLVASRRNSGLEGLVVTFFARQGLPPRDAEATLFSTARTGVLVGSGLGVVIAAADLARLIAGAGRPGLRLGETLGVSALGIMLGIALGAVAGAVSAALVTLVARLAGQRPGGYEAGRFTIALLLLAAPLAVREVPALGPEASAPATLLLTAGIALAAAGAVFLLLPSMVLRAMDGRWGVAVGGGATLALALGLTALGLLGVGSYDVASRGSSSPNVLVVSVSGLRADFVGAYTGGASLTAGIDALAARGALMRTAITPSTSIPSAAASMLTGRYPATHRLREPGGRLAFTSEGLPVLLASHGYRTAAFVSSRGLDGHSTHFGELFDLYDDMTTWVDWVSGLALTHSLGLSIERERYAIRPASATSEAFREWLARIPEGPWFAWVHLADPSRPRPVAVTPGPMEEIVGRLFANDGPLVPPPSWAAADELSRRRSEWVSGYLAATLAVDNAVAGMISTLAQRGDHTRTIVVIVSERGVSLGEEGTWFEAGRSLNEGILQVPWVIYGPGIAAGRVVDGPCSLVDVYPTVLGLLGRSGPKRLEGEDLSRYLVEEGDFERPSHSGPVFSETGGVPPDEIGFAVRLGDWKLVREPGGRERTFLVTSNLEAEIYEPRDRNERLRQQLSDILVEQLARDRP